MRKTIRSIVCQCITCHRYTYKPQYQLLGQLPLECVTPGSVLQKVGVDYVGPVKIKYGMICKPTIVKAYICVFVSLSFKAVHLEAVSDLTSEAFIATLRPFIARRGYPTLIWNDNGTNFVGANREIKRSSMSFSSSSKAKESYLISALLTTFNGVSFLNMVLTLVDCGKLLSKVPKPISDVS